MTGSVMSLQFNLINQDIQWSGHYHKAGVYNSQWLAQLWLAQYINIHNLWVLMALWVSDCYWIIATSIGPAINSLFFFLAQVLCDRSQNFAK